MATETILLVEDEPFVREVTCEILISAGYFVFKAENSADAVRLFESRFAPIDLLLTDIVLPGESGDALAARLKRQNASLKVLFTTGYSEHMRTGMAVNEEFLPKPFNRLTLLRTVKRLLNPEPLDSRQDEFLMPVCGTGEPAGSAPECLTEALCG